MPIEVEGLRQLVRDLEAAGVEVADLTSGMAKVAARGAALAAGFAPVRSGALRASVRGNRAKAKAVVMAGKARVPYAGAINYGFKRRNIRPARFLERADQALETEAPQLLEASLDEILTRKGLT